MSQPIIQRFPVPEPVKDLVKFQPARVASPHQPGGGEMSQPIEQKPDVLTDTVTAIVD